MTGPAELFGLARTWIADDIDDADRAELTALLGAAEAGDPAAVEDLADRFRGRLEFGTAGLRGILGAGPNRINRAVVVAAAAGLTAYLTDLGKPSPLVVVGYDARRRSDVFARDTAAVVTAAGGRALLLPRPLPTPVLAYAIRRLDADAGVMVTASHNPARDNGYKVYLGDGMQIVPPADVDIAARIQAAGPARLIPRAAAGWTVLDDRIVADYVDDVAGLLDPDGPRQVRIVHTALHGVGDETVRAVFAAAGFPPLLTVGTQAAPDPDFPTVAFPNPEEPGAIDAALDLARRTEPDVVIANDPDADRCAVAVRDGADWRMLRGDELGVLLGRHLLERGLRGADGPDVPPAAATSIVSSRALAALAAAAGVRHEETLTGFKWIARVPGIGYGYEEAIGYCVAPHLVRDKDGISAALLVADLVARCARDGRTLLDLLDDIAAEHGVYATDAYSVRVADLALVEPVLAGLSSNPPARLGGESVCRCEDLAHPSDDLPPTPGVRLVTDRDSRIVVRPSGTEPKLKAYLEVVEPVTNGEVTAARGRARRRLAALAADLRAVTG